MDLTAIRSVFSPSVLFLVFNLVIGTILVISSRHRSSHSSAAATDGGGGDQRPLARSSSSNVLERVRSIGLFRFRSGDLPPIIDVDVTPSSAAPQEQRDPPIEHQQQQQFRRIHSESEVKRGKKAAVKEGKMKKSASAMTAATWRAEAVEVEIKRRPVAVLDEEVDAKADDFINRFRQQLKLQRLDSLLRYKEMLTNRN